MLALKGKMDKALLLNYYYYGDIFPMPYTILF